MTRIYSACIFGTLAIATMVIVGIFDFNVHGMYFLAEAPPVFSWYFCLRSLFALLFSIFLAMLIYYYRDSADRPQSSGRVSWIGFVASFFSIFIMIAAIQLLAISPALFNILALEDSIFEWASALALLLGCGFLLTSIFRAVLRTQSWNTVYVLAMVFVIVMFVIGMEEISWMQRVIDLQTPGWLRAMNRQRELNVHNLASDEAENLYYAGAFVLLVVFPFVSHGSSIWKRASSIRFFVPSRYVLLIGALTTTYSFEMWNIFWMQIVFYFGLAALFVQGQDARRNGNQTDHVLFLVAILTLLASHFFDLLLGSGLVRRWEDTELKELMIAIGLFVYSIEIGSRILQGPKYSRSL